VRAITEYGTPLKKCNNPECNRLTTADYCCGPCSLADTKRYEIHECGPLGHSLMCNERHSQRSAK
jgi:hypothetical protein